MGTGQSSSRYGRRLPLSCLDDAARTNPKRIMYRCPVSTDLSDGFRAFTTLEIANAVNRVAGWLERTIGKGTSFETLGYIGPGKDDYVSSDLLLTDAKEDLRYFALVLGASKAGYKVLLCSRRNSTDGQGALIDATDCKIWLTTSQLPMDHILKLRTLKEVRVPEFDEVFSNERVAPYPYKRTYEQARRDPFCVVHTSGSTGLPKPIILTQGYVCGIDGLQNLQSVGRMDLQCRVLQNQSIYCQMPMFHVAGLIVGLWTPIYMNTTIIYSPPVPPSLSVVEAMLAQGNFAGMVMPPSIVEDMAAVPELVEKLKNVKFLCYGGGPLAQWAGDKVTEKTLVVCTMGTSESGWMPFMASDKEDWNYLKPHPASGLRFREVADSLYQMVEIRTPMMEGISGTFETFPDLKEYASGDLFSKHPTKPGYWKTEGRYDDVIVLSNGEKIQPIAMEDKLGADPQVRSALIVGQARFQSAVLIEPNESIPSSKKEQFIDDFWATVQQANASAPSHAALDKDHILIVEPNTFSRAGKGTVQRFQTVRLLKNEIDLLYQQVEDKAFAASPKYNVSSEGAIRNGIHQSVCGILQKENIPHDQDLFAIGLNSLQTISIVKLVKAGLQKRDLKFDAQTVYSYPTIAGLAGAAYSLLQSGTLSIQTREDKVREMESMLSKYTKNLPTSAAAKLEKKGLRNVVLTGSTGSLGSYILDSLMRDESVGRIWCLNRSADAEQRQKSGHTQKGLSTSFKDAGVQFHVVDLAKADLGLPSFEYEDLRRNATHIIHNQWQVDFNLSLASFEPHIAGVRNLINLSATSTYVITILFTSSISVVDAWKSQSLVPENIISDFSVANMGYGQSKLISEVLLLKAADEGHMNSDIVRIGQIAGPVLHGDRGVWTRKEWFPTIVAASAHIGMIPSDLGTQTAVDWIPVDLLSKSIVELAFSVPTPSTNAESVGQTRVFHTVNPHTTPWSSLVPEIESRLAKKMKKEFKIVTLQEWVKTLAESIQRKDGADVVPGTQLLGFYEEMASKVKGAEGGVVLDTTDTQTVSKTLAGMEGVSRKWMELWLKQWGF